MTFVSKEFRVCIIIFPPLTICWGDEKLPKNSLTGGGKGRNLKENHRQGGILGTDRPTIECTDNEGTEVKVSKECNNACPSLSFQSLMAIEETQETRRLSHRSWPRGESRPSQDQEVKK